MFLNSFAAEAWGKRAVVTMRPGSESCFCYSERRGGPELQAYAKPTLCMGIPLVRVVLDAEACVVAES